MAFLQTLEKPRRTNSKLNIVNSFGVGTARYIAALPPSKPAETSGEEGCSSTEAQRLHIDLPLGASIVRWDIESKTRTKFVRAHSDMITGICQSPTNARRVVTTSERGDVSLWSNEWELLGTAKHTEEERTRHLSFSSGGKRIATTSEKVSTRGCIGLFEVQEDDSIVLIKEIGKGMNFTFVEWAAEDDSTLFAVRQTRVQRRTRGAPADASAPGTPKSQKSTEMSACSEEKRGGAPGEKEQKPPTEVEIVLLRAETGDILKRKSIGTAEDTARDSIVVRNEDRACNTVAVAQKRIVSVIDLNTLDVMYTVHAPGSGLVKSLIFRKDMLVVPSDNGYISLWKRDSLVRQHSVGIPSGVMYYISWSEADRLLWICNESGLHVSSLRLPELSTSADHSGDTNRSTDTSAGKEDAKEQNRQAEEQKAKGKKDVRQDHKASLEDTAAGVAGPSVMALEGSGRKISFHQMTCCGIDFNSDGEKVMTGDFMGNVFVWEHKGGLSHSPLCSVWCPGPVRSISWHKFDAFALIGCMDGSVYLWALPHGHRSANNVQLLLSLDAAVTSLEWHYASNTPRPRGEGTKEEKDKEKEHFAHVLCEDLLACGTTGGVLSTYKVSLLLSGKGGEIERTPKGKEAKQTTPKTDGTDPSVSTKPAFAAKSVTFNTEEGKTSMTVVAQPLLSMLAHAPQEASEHFGSISKYAEIWSVAWSPEGDRIATSSEDQTTVIWDANTGEKTATLTGHITAVTSVDWKNTDNCGPVLATCADDRTVHVWDPSSWTKRFTLNTMELEEWHTITYLCLGKTQLAAATQNGYVFIWDLATGDKVASAKMHSGSIEGLKWCTQSNHIASCASDCTIHVYKVVQEKHQLANEDEQCESVTAAPSSAL